jgi:hypothetical protein
VRRALVVLVLIAMDNAVTSGQFTSPKNGQFHRTRLSVSTRERTTKAEKQGCQDVDMCT